MVAFRTRTLNLLEELGDAISSISPRWVNAFRRGASMYLYVQDYQQRPAVRCTAPNTTSDHHHVARQQEEHPLVRRLSVSIGKLELTALSSSSFAWARPASTSHESLSASQRRTSD